MQRAYSLLRLKRIDDDLRTVAGFATTPHPDIVGDQVDPLGVAINLPLPLLLQHDPERPIGRVTEARATKEGIWIVATLASVDSPPELKSFLDNVWAQIRARLIGGFSIGFRAIEARPIPGGGTFFSRWSLIEVSAVTCPCNPSATIETIKAADLRQMAEYKRTADGSRRTSKAAMLEAGRAAVAASRKQAIAALRSRLQAVDTAHAKVLSAPPAASAEDLAALHMQLAVLEAKLGAEVTACAARLDALENAPPRKWHFDIERDENGQMIDVTASPTT